MITDSEANVVFISDLLEHRYAVLVDRLRGILSDHGIPLKIIRRTKDFWCRDFMPVQVGSGQFVWYRYDPDYLRGYEHLKTHPSDIELIPEITSCEQSEIVLDGGNVVRWGDRCVMTDKVYKENPSIRRDHLRTMLSNQLRVADPIVIPKEPYDVIGHADGMVRFLDANTVFVNDYSQVDPSFGQRLRSVLQRARLNLIELPYCPENKIIDGIASAVGCYANFLMVRGLIVMPVFGMPHDDIALRVVAERAPHLAVESIDCFKLARKGGVLNCVTWAISTK